jgi:similar to stage IV sporulation protein
VASPYPVTAAERERVLDLATQAGLYKGRLSFDLDYSAISRYVLINAPELIFVQAEQQGIRAVLHIIKRDDIPLEERLKPPGDIIAEIDGTIESIMVKSGQAAVEAGDTVNAGDVLVYSLGGGKLTPASALITARIRKEGIDSWPLIERGLRPSGQSSRSLTICIGEGETALHILLSGTKGAPYEYFAHKEQVIKAVLWRKIQMPVEVIQDTWYEYQQYVTIYTKEQALYHATQKALDLAQKQLPGGAHLLNQTVQELPGSKNMVYVQVILEARADIGKFAPLSGLRPQLKIEN